MNGRKVEINLEKLQWERVICKRLERSILRNCIMWIQKSGMQSICAALMVLEEVIILRRSQ